MAVEKHAVWRADDWCSALSAHFFSADYAQLPVLFLVEDEVLAQLHPSGDSQLAG